MFYFVNYCSWPQTTIAPAVMKVHMHSDIVVHVENHHCEDKRPSVYAEKLTIGTIYFVSVFGLAIDSTKTKSPPPSTLPLCNALEGSIYRTKILNRKH